MKTTFTLQVNEEFRVACLLFNIPAIKLLQGLINDVRLPVAKDVRMPDEIIMATDYFMHHAERKYHAVHTNPQKEFLKERKCAALIGEAVSTSFDR